MLLYAAFHDWVARTVPNAVSGVLAIVGFIARFLAGDWVWGVAGAAIVFVLCAFCWRRGWMGGADVKLLGAASLAVPAVAIVPFVLATTISGAILATLYLMGGAWARAHHRSHPTARTRDRKSTR